MGLSDSDNLVPMATYPTYAQVGYEAYKQSTGGKTWDGKDMPTWEQVQERTPHVARAWAAAAREILMAWQSDGWAGA